MRYPIGMVAIFAATAAASAHFVPAAICAFHAAHFAAKLPDALLPDEFSCSK
jgi:hypothetical protein